MLPVLGACVEGTVATGNGKENHTRQQKQSCLVGSLVNTICEKSSTLGANSRNFVVTITFFIENSRDKMSQRLGGQEVLSTVSWHWRQCQ